MKSIVPSTKLVALVGELPDRFSDEPEKLFDSASKRLVSEWRQRSESREGKGRKGIPGTLDWLTQSLYEMVGHIVGEEQGDVFASRLKHYSPRRRARPVDGLRVFQQGALAIFAHDPKAITESQRDRVSKRAWYAYRHYVPPPFITGFFRQIDSAGFSARCRHGIESSFDSWIVAQRRADLDEDCLRGRYPPRIEQAAFNADHDEDYWPDGNDDCSSGEEDE